VIVVNDEQNGPEVIFYDDSRDCCLVPLDNWQIMYLQQLKTRWTLQESSYNSRQPRRNEHCEGIHDPTIRSHF